MKIRPARPPDLSALCALHTANWRAEYREDLSAEALARGVETRMSDYWADIPRDAIVTVAEGPSGAITGFARTLPEHEKGPYVDALHVSAASRGAGVGEALMRDTARRLLARGAESLWLNVMDRNEAARRFYRRLGGRESPPCDEVLLGEPVRARSLHWDDLRVLADGA